MYAKLSDLTTQGKVEPLIFNPNLPYKLLLTLKLHHKCQSKCWKTKKQIKYLLTYYDFFCFQQLFFPNTICPVKQSEEIRRHPMKEMHHHEI